MRKIEMNTIKETLKHVKKPAKKTVKKMIVAAVAIIVLTGTGTFAAEKVEDKQEQKVNEANYKLLKTQAAENGITLITKEEAAQTAFYVAGVNSSEVKHLEVSLEQDRYNEDRDDDNYNEYDKDDKDKNDREENNGTNEDSEYNDSNADQYIYEISFIHNGLEYEFDINGVDKKILNSEVESWME